MIPKIIFLMVITIATYGANIIDYANLKIVERYEWDAEQTTIQSDIYSKLPSYVIIRDSYLDMCFFPEECKSAVKLVQYLHKNVGNFGDIIDNFRIGGDGNVYVGRGWDGVPTFPFNFNDSSIIIAFMGDCSRYMPTNVQLRATQLLIELGVKMKKLPSDYKLLGCTQVLGNLLPLGQKLYKIIRTWPHWSPQP